MKKHFMFIILLCTLFALSACGTGNDKNPVTGDNEDSVADEGTEDTETTTDSDSNDSEATDKSDDDSGKNIDEGHITKTGIYNGQADPHTIEIETDEGPVAFQLTLEAREDVKQLTENEQVTYTYTEDGDQRTIQSIKPSK